MGKFGCFLTHCYCLHGQNIGGRWRARGIFYQVHIKVCNAVAVARALAGKLEATQLALMVGRVKHHNGVAAAAAWEVAIGHPGCQQIFIQAALHPLAQNRFSLLSQHGPIALPALLLGLAELPLAGK